jgi:hypothetical protein
MSPHVVMYDENFGWSPSFNAYHQVGGWEVYQVQIATWLAAQGLSVLAVNPGRSDSTDEDGVTYFPHIKGAKTGITGDCRALVLGRHSRRPRDVRAGRVVTSAVDDPRYCDETYDHLIGQSTIVCLSEWQAGLYRAKGHDAVVIPSMIDDYVYSMPRNQIEGACGFVCLNAWNKGTEATLAVWAKMRARYPEWKATLAVGSPYSHPEDAEARCRQAGASWLGTLSPRDVVAYLASAEAVFRVNDRHPETYSVCDAIAEVVGTRVHTLHTGELGAVRETLVSPYLTDNYEEFASGVMFPMKPYPKARDVRLSKIMPMWLDVLGLERKN